MSLDWFNQYNDKLEDLGIKINSIHGNQEQVKILRRNLTLSMYAIIDASNLSTEEKINSMNILLETTSETCNNLIHRSN